MLRHLHWVWTPFLTPFVLCCAVLCCAVLCAGILTPPLVTRLVMQRCLCWALIHPCQLLMRWPSLSAWQLGSREPTHGGGSASAPRSCLVSRCNKIILSDHWMISESSLSSLHFLCFYHHRSFKGTLYCLLRHHMFLVRCEWGPWVRMWGQVISLNGFEFWRVSEAGRSVNRKFCPVSVPGEFRGWVGACRENCRCVFGKQGAVGIGRRFI
jgi:hypothetical protein